MARVRDFSGFGNPGGFCSLLQNHELPGSPRKRSRTKTINMLWTLLPAGSIPNQNEKWIAGVCVCVCVRAHVCVCVCGLKLVGKKSPVFSDGNIQFGPLKGMVKWMCAVLSLSLRLFVTPWTVILPGSSVHEDSPGKNTGVGWHFLLQGIFLTWGSNRHLLLLLH